MTSTAWAAVKPDVVTEIVRGLRKPRHRASDPRQRPLRIGGLFEGYSGLTMGVREVLGGDLAWYSDIDPGALKILGHHHPGVPNLGDITAVDWSTVEPVDVMCGGFPCQDVSAAGKRAGLRPGTRSGLWAHFAYAIDQLRPGLVVIENVRGLLTARGGPVTDDLALAWAARDLADRLLDHFTTSHAIAVRKGRTDHARDIAARRARVVGLRSSAVARARRADRRIVRALGAVLGSLDDLGYDAAWHGLRAADPEVGGCHGRFRVFIFAWPRAAAVERGRLDRGTRDPLGSAILRAAAAGPRKDLSRRDLILLKTPTAQLGVNGGSQHPDQRKAGGHGPTLADEVEHLLPTPTAMDTEASGGSSPKDVTLTDAVVRTDLGRGINARHLPTPTTRDVKGHNQRGDDSCLAGALLPTPRATDGSNGGPNQRGSSGDLMLPSAVQSSAWGDYDTAVRRWSNRIDRDAPPPTETGPMGGQRLSPRFVEWMMGLPAGWVVDVPDITRNEALKALGNGVVPQQAAAALREVLTWGPVREAFGLAA